MPLGLWGSKCESSRQAQGHGLMFTLRSAASSSNATLNFCLQDSFWGSLSNCSLIYNGKKPKQLELLTRASWADFAGRGPGPFAQYHSWELEKDFYHFSFCISRFSFYLWECFSALFRFWGIKNCEVLGSDGNEGNSRYDYTDGQIMLKIWHLSFFRWTCMNNTLPKDRLILTGRYVPFETLVYELV